VAPQSNGLRAHWRFDPAGGTAQISPMRLTPETVQAIRDEVSRADPQAEIWLFGSRVNDEARGGDIDLLVVSDCITFADELRLRTALLDRIGWQRLDLIVRSREQLREPLAALAMETGIKL
jgi:predicted nucleotidyltransferase